jgi:hypothetical protein
MRYHSIRSQYADLVEAAQRALEGDVDDATEKKENLGEAAGELVTHLDEDARNGLNAAIEEARRILAEIAELNPEDKDFEKDLAGLRFELEHLADGFHFPLIVPEPEARAGDLGAPRVGDVIANGEWKTPFDQERFTRPKLASYAILTTLNERVARTAFHRRSQARDLLLAGLLGFEIPRDSSGPPKTRGTPARPEARPKAEDTSALSGEERLRRLIDREIPGGEAARPDLLGQLAAAEIRSPEDLLEFTGRNWTRNVNEGLHLRQQLILKLGAEHEAALPPASELDSLVKAARRDS